MEDKLFDWCLSHWPILTVNVVILSVCIWLTIKIVNGYHYWKRKITENSQHALRIDAEIVPMLTKINTSVNGLAIYLRTKDKAFDHNLFMSRSPIRLTDLGLKVLEAIGGKKYVDEHKKLLIDKMNQIGIKTALDSQQQAPIVISECFNDDSFSEIKDYIYNNPFYKHVVDGEEISVALDMGSFAVVLTYCKVTMILFIFKKYSNDSNTTYTYRAENR